MSSHTRWHELRERLRDLPEETRLRTPSTDVLFTIDDIQEDRIIIRYERSGETEPLEKAQFETLYRRLTDSDGGYELRQLPPEAAPYPAVLSLHPRVTIDTDRGVISETDSPSPSPLRDDSLGLGSGSYSRTEPDVAIYADALMLVDALERYDLDALADVETEVLVDLDTLLSDVQHHADELQDQLAETLADRDRRSDRQC